MLPPYSITPENLQHLRDHTHALARALNVVGLMNVQYAIHDGQVYVLEVNPRASRTVPFVGKAIGLPLAKIAARVMVGMSLEEQVIREEIVPEHVSVKEAVLPFIKFPGADSVSRSRDEVNGGSHGHWPRFRHGLPQGTDGSKYRPARDWSRIRQRCRQR